MKIAVASAVTVVIGLNQAQADTSSSTIDTYAGIAPVLTFSCTPVKFGVLRVPVRTSGGGVTTITLGLVNDIGTLGGNQTGVAFAGNTNYYAARGVCTLTGSSAADAVLTTINNTPGSLAMASDSASVFAGLAAPQTAVTGMTFALDVPGSSTITSGGSVFYVGGTLTIPAAIVAANYGAYKGGSTSITVSDNQ